MEVDTRRLIVALLLVFLLGIAFAVVSGQYTEQTSEQLPWIVYGISFVSVLVGATLVLLFQWKINQQQMQKMLAMLPREERLLVRLLTQQPQIEQSRLVTLSGLSKVKVSRTLSKLEQRGVVQKKSMGNTNLVILKL